MAEEAKAAEPQTKEGDRELLLGKLPRPGDHVAVEQEHTRLPILGIVLRVADAEMGVLRVYLFPDEEAGTAAFSLDLAPEGSKRAGKERQFWRRLAERGPYA